MFFLWQTAIPLSDETSKELVIKHTAHTTDNRSKDIAISLFNQYHEQCKF